MAEEIQGVEGFAGEIDNIVQGIESEAVNGLGAVRKANWRGRISNMVNRATSNGAAIGAQRRSGNMMLNERTSPMAWFYEKKHLLPQTVLDKLKNKEMQVCDTALYSLKDASGKQAMMLIDTTTKIEDGVCNINEGQLQQDENFLCTGFALLYGLREAGEAPQLAKFGEEYPAALRQARLTLKVGDVPIFHDENMPLEMVNIDRTDMRAFYYPLSNPKWFATKRIIKSELYTAAALPANSSIKLVLFGVQIKSGNPSLK